jgi:aerobic-type carbon monoxide dehydrogenase small subunit (CoxS/CutS family)
MNPGSDLIVLTLNGVRREATVDRRKLLVEALREDFETTGPKVGCATGDCGACTVLMDGDIRKSCLELAVAANGSVVTTLEGIAGDQLTPLQEAFWDEYAFQCGFCLSGMLFSAQDLIDRVPNPTEHEIRTAISGNLCRCTGYDTIVNAIRRASAGRALINDAAHLAERALHGVGVDDAHADRDPDRVLHQTRE